MIESTECIAAQSIASWSCRASSAMTTARDSRTDVRTPTAVSPWGQIVTGVVSVRAGERLMPDDIDKHCRGLLAGYKRPRRIEIVDELPMTSDGRVDREAVIARLKA